MSLRRVAGALVDGTVFGKVKQALGGRWAVGGGALSAVLQGGLCHCCCRCHAFVPGGWHGVSSTLQYRALASGSLTLGEWAAGCGSSSAAAPRWRPTSKTSATSAWRRRCRCARVYLLSNACAECTAAAPTRPRPPLQLQLKLTSVTAAVLPPPSTGLRPDGDHGHLLHHAAQPTDVLHRCVPVVALGGGRGALHSAGWLFAAASTKRAACRQSRNGMLQAPLQPALSALPLPLPCPCLHAVGPPLSATEFRLESVPELNYDAQGSPAKVCCAGVRRWCVPDGGRRPSVREGARGGRSAFAHSLAAAAPPPTPAGRGLHPRPHGLCRLLQGRRQDGRRV